jgi:integrase
MEQGRRLMQRPATMKLALEYAYLCKDRDRHGNVRYYFRRTGKKTRISARPGTLEFQIEYEALLKTSTTSQRVPKPEDAPRTGTYRWLCEQYLRSTDFKQLDPKTQHVRRQVLEHTWTEPIGPNAKETFADFPVARMSTKAVRVLRDRKRGFPEAANVRVKAIRRLFRWALEDEIPGIKSNPARDVSYLRGRPGGFHSWTIDEVEQYERCHTIGTTARLALALLLYTGQRRSDIVLFGRQHVRAGWLHFTQQKNRNRRPITLELPVLPVLQRIIDATKTGDLAFLVNENGQPFTANGFGNKMRDWCDEAGLPHCTSHGLRKTGAAIAAENGATAHELMSIFGWLTLKEAERYTRAAEQKKIAGRAMAMLERSENRT